MTDKQDIIQAALDAALVLEDDRHVVNLQDQNLTDADMPGLVAVLQGCPQGVRLELKGNQIGPEGAKTLAGMLRTNPHIEGLALTLNPIGDEGALAIAAELHEDSPLTVLLVAGCGLSDAASHQLEHTLIGIKPRNLIDFEVEHELSDKAQGVLSDNREAEDLIDSILDEDERPQIYALCMISNRLPAARYLGGHGDLEKVLDILETMPELKLDRPISRKHLTRADASGFTPLDNPKTWQNMAQIVPLLEKPLTKKFLLETKNRDGDPIICNAIRAGATEALVSMLNEQGERIEAADITPKIEEAFYDTHMKESQALFTDVQFEGKSSADMRAMVTAINVEVQDITNFHRLSSHLKREEQQARRLGGIEA